MFGKPPRAVTADRGYGETKTDEALTDLGVKTVVIPRKGKPSAARRQVEHGSGFLTGARTWCGLGVLTHNSVKIDYLIQAHHTGAAGHLNDRTTEPAAARPP